MAFRALATLALIATVGGVVLFLGHSFSFPIALAVGYVFALGAVIARIVEMWRTPRGHSEPKR